MVDVQDIGGIVGLGSLSWKMFTLLILGFLPTKMQQWQIYGEGMSMEVDVGRFLLEDLSKIES